MVSCQKNYVCMGYALAPQSTYPLKFPHSCNFTLHLSSTVMPVTAVMFKGCLCRHKTGRRRKMNISRNSIRVFLVVELGAEVEVGASSFKMQKVAAAGGLPSDGQH